MVTMTENRPFVPAVTSGPISLKEYPVYGSTEPAPPSSTLETVIFPVGTPVPGGFELSHPLLVEVEIGPDGFVIRSGEVDEESYGASYEGAYLDFVTSLRDRFRSLSRREERLSQHDRSVLERLRSLLKAA